MGKWQRALSLAAAAALGVLAVTAAVGAHLGAARAEAMFCSAPMAVVWAALAAGLAVGAILTLWPHPWRNAGLSAAYAGAALIMAGAMLAPPPAAASERGAGAVLAGLALLAAGIVWHLWLRPLAAALRPGGAHGRQD